MTKTATNRLFESMKEDWGIFLGLFGFVVVVAVIAGEFVTL